MLTALGWPSGELPSPKALILHMRRRAEHEYAQHLFDHGFTTPGRWCDECYCICAPAVDAHVAAMADPEPTHDHNDYAGGFRGLRLSTRPRRHPGETSVTAHTLTSTTPPTLTYLVS